MLSFGVALDPAIEIVVQLKTSGLAAGNGNERATRMFHGPRLATW